MIDGELAKLYLQHYRVLVMKAYTHYAGEQRVDVLLRSWRYLALPLVDALLWREGQAPETIETAIQLAGWLLWLQTLPDPEATFRDLYDQFRSKGADNTIIRP